MVIDISRQELGKLYSKAEKKYIECIHNSDNAFLKEEVLIPLEDIQVRVSNIKVVYCQDIIDRYSLEINLTLWDGSDKLNR